jgi:hypothetical protein
MIPIYIQDTVGRGTAGLPPKNPLYFIRKGISQLPRNLYDIIVLNTDDSHDNILPPDISTLHTQPEGAAYDIEEVNVQFIGDAYIEPKTLGDGSVAMESLHNHALIEIKGFVRGNSFEDLQRKVSYLNYSFDPVINYLEGASTWDNTIEPLWQPFENAGFFCLAWFDPAARAGAPGGSEEGVWEGEEINPFDVEPYGRLNRFIFVRSIGKSVSKDFKFSDMNAAFTIRLLVVDPRIYEFIPPAEWFGNWQFDDSTIIPLSSKMFIDRAHFDETVESENGTVSQTSTEDFVYTDYLWREGPGWREVVTVPSGE